MLERTLGARVGDYGGHGVIRRVGFQFVYSGGQRLDVPWVAARSTIGERHRWVAAHVATGEKAYYRGRQAMSSSRLRGSRW